MDVLKLIIRVLKFFFLLPHDNLSWPVNLSLILGMNLLTTVDSSFTFSAVIYQFYIGIEDINIVIDGLIGVCDYLGYCFILVCFHRKADEIKKTIKDIDIFLKHCDPEVILNAEAKVNFYTKVFLIYFCGGLFFNGLVPVLDKKNCNDRRLSDFYRRHDPCALPIRKMYPFDASKIQRFSVIFVAESITCVVVSFGILLTTMTLIGLLMHVIAQIENCRKDIIAIFDKNPTDYQIQSTERMRHKVDRCIKYHIDIISYTNRIFEIFGLMLIVHISLTSMIFGVLGYQIVKAENPTDKIRYFMQMGGWMAILFMTCFFGQRIIDESTSIADVTYECCWYTGPVNLQKNVGLMIMRGQKPMTLKAASIGIISLETFVSVLKTAYSYFTLLLTISN